MRAGEKLLVTMRASRAADGSTWRGAAVALFFAPGKDPERVPSDRVPDRQAPLALDEASRVYAAEVSTRGWEPGRWTVQGCALGPDGTAEGWGFAPVQLDR